MFMKKTWMGVLLSALCVVLPAVSWSSPARASDPRTAAYENEKDNYVLSAGSWLKVWWDPLPYGTNIVAYAETSSQYEGIDMFVCDSYNLAEWEAGRSATVYGLKTGVHVGSIDFTSPSTKAWYFVFSNRDGLTSDTVDILLDYDGADIPYYSSLLHDEVENHLVLEPLEHYAVYQYATTGTELSGAWHCYFATDSVDFFIVDQANYNKFKNGQSYLMYSSKENYHSASFGAFSVPYSDTWYCVFDATDAADTVTLSLYVDAEVYAPPPSDDIYEPNDYSSEATLVTEGTYSSLKCKDDDWYKVYVSAGYGLSASITFASSAGDLDLRLYSPSLGLLVSSETTLNIESVSVSPVSTSGYYYLKVFGFGGATNDDYDLIIDITYGGGSSGGSGGGGYGGDHPLDASAIVIALVGIGGIVGLVAVVVVVVKKKRVQDADEFFW
ncbi:MAG: hypothetical protein Kow0069_31990 [Promethearchaeota archaeon]